MPSRNVSIGLWIERAALWHVTAITLTNGHLSSPQLGFSGHPLYRPITFALGMTIELMCKAVYVQNHNEIPPMKAHATAHLFQDAGIVLDPRLRGVADNLVVSVTWMAKYPEAKHPNMPRNFARYDSLWNDYDTIMAALVAKLNPDNERQFGNETKRLGFPSSTLAARTR